MTALDTSEAPTGVSIASAGDADADGYSEIWLAVRSGRRTQPGELWLLSGRTGKVQRLLGLPAQSREWALGLALQELKDLDGDTASDVAVASSLPGGEGERPLLRLRILSGALTCVLSQWDIPDAEPTELLDWPWQSPLMQFLPLRSRASETALRLVVIRGGDPEPNRPLGSAFLLDLADRSLARPLPVTRAARSSDLSVSAAVPIESDDETSTALVLATRPGVTGTRVTGGEGLVALEADSGRVRWTCCRGEVVTGLATLGRAAGGGLGRVAAAVLRVEEYGYALRSRLVALSGETGEVLSSTERGPLVLVRGLAGSVAAAHPAGGALHWVEEGLAPKRPTFWERRLCRWDGSAASPTCVSLDVHDRPSLRSLLVVAERHGAGGSGSDYAVIVGGWWAGAVDGAVEGVLGAWQSDGETLLWERDWHELLGGTVSMLEACEARSGPGRSEGVGEGSGGVDRW